MRDPVTVRAGLAITFPGHMPVRLPWGGLDIISWSGEVAAGPTRRSPAPDPLGGRPEDAAGDWHTPVHCGAGP